MSQWLFDLGNTRLKYAALEPGGAGAVEVWAHQDQERPLPEPAQLPQGACAWISSVADPALRDALVARLSGRFAQVEVVASQARCGRLRNGYAEPARLGVDRFLALLACAQQARDCLVVGVGTALTVDLLDREGQHHGGLIAPSPTSMRQAIHLRARHLPAEGGQVSLFADNTLDALQGGAMGAALGLIERSVLQAARQIGRSPVLLVHGGGAEPLLPYLRDVHHVPGLVLDGLAQWALLHGQGNR